MQNRPISLVLWFISSLSLLLLLAGCGGSNAPWTLIWRSIPLNDQNNPPSTAFMASAYAQRPDGSQVLPAASTWLATGANPKFGLALSQLDPAGQFFTLAVLSIDGGSNRWTITESAPLTKPARGSGIPASQMNSNAWTLPSGTYNTTQTSIADTPPGGSAQLWLSDTNQELVLAHIYTTLQAPAAHSAIAINGQPGWMATQGKFTIIAIKILPQRQGLGQSKDDLGTLLLASTTNPQKSQLLATQAATHLNDLLPS